MKPNFNKIKLVRCALTDFLISQFNGTFSVKREQLHLHQHLNVVGVVVGRRTPSLVRTLRYLLLEIRKLVKKNGLVWTVKYLKACSVLLMQAVGGMKIPSTRPLGVAVSRTKNGLPRIIPSVWRARIRSGDVIAIRVILTVFSVYRIIVIPGICKLSSITDCGVDLSGIRRILSRLVIAFWNLRPYTSTPLARMRVELFPIYRSGASSARWGLTQVSTSVYSLFRSGLKLASNELGSVISELNSMMRGNNLPSLYQDWKSMVSPWLDSPLGRLGFKLEAAGKVRVFAMVDPWTNWLLKPFHDAIFLYLSKIQSDGTFDQLAPVKRLLDRGYTRFWCYDLSSATDRLPLILQMALLEPVFGSRFASLWGKLLTDRDYVYPKDKSVGVHETGSVRYSVGQPMGALSSWAMLALTHHFIVQWAYWSSINKTGKVLVIRWFSNYAVLGDDIVIADGRVAREYVRIMKRLGVGIGLAKSLVSRKGALEFAKRFYVNGVDCSPLPYKEYVAARSSIQSGLELKRKWNLSFPQLVRARGYGFRVLSTLGAPVFRLAPKVRNLYLVWMRSTVSVWSWIALGVNDTPNWHGAVVTYLESRLSRLDARLRGMQVLLDKAYKLTVSDVNCKGFVGRWRNDPFFFTPPCNITSVLLSPLCPSIINRLMFKLWDCRFDDSLDDLKRVRFLLVQKRRVLTMIKSDLSLFDPLKGLEALELEFDAVEKQLDSIVIPNLDQRLAISEKTSRSSLFYPKLWLKVVQVLRTAQKK